MGLVFDTFFDVTVIYTISKYQKSNKKSAVKPVVLRLDGTFANIQKKCIKHSESGTTFGGVFCAQKRGKNEDIQRI